jgi:putative endonuclease
MPGGCIVYILGSHSGTLYIGVTSDFDTRLAQHRNGSLPGFASKYGCTPLLYSEEFGYIEDAIAREKQLKG